MLARSKDSVIVHSPGLTVGGILGFLDRLLDEKRPEGGNKSLLPLSTLLQLNLCKVLANGQWLYTGGITPKLPDHRSGLRKVSTGEKLCVTGRSLVIQQALIAETPAHLSCHSGAGVKHRDLGSSDLLDQ